MDTMRMRLGIVGAGRIVERAHLPVLAAMPDVHVAGLFDPDMERARELAQRFEIPNTCRSLDELLNLTLDAVLIACPNHLHAATSIAALEAGAHVLCEKPMATNSADAQAMAAACERHGRELMIGFTNRFRPEVVALEEAVRAGRLGTITGIRCGWLRRAGIPGIGTWFTDAGRSGGGALVDLGSHMVGLAVWLGGKHAIVTASCVTQTAYGDSESAGWYRSADTGPGRCDVETGASGFVVLDGPLDLFVEVSWACAVPHDRTYLHVIGKRGVAKLETVFGFSPQGERPDYPLQMWLDGASKPEQAAGSTDLLQPYRDQWRCFLNGIQNGRSLRAWLQEDLAGVQVIEAMYRAAKQVAETNDR
ncbi:MAG: Gfo/Idh/MocA family protein [Chloroflexota bacterium]